MGCYYIMYRWDIINIICIYVYYIIYMYVLYDINIRD